MLFYLDNYKLSNRFCSVAFDEETLDKLLSKGLNAVIVKKNMKLLFMPDKVTLTLSKKNYEKFSICNNYDVIYFSETGKGFLHYSNETDDNAFILTQKCNSNCIMCPTAEYIRKFGSIAISPEGVLDSIKYIPNDARHITITGGEPFLVKDIIFDILKSCKEYLNTTSYLLLTNGRAFSYKAYVDKFINTKPDDILVGIPLHGYNSQTHDFITQSKGGFSQTIAGIKNLLANNIDVEIRMVVSKLNKDYIEKIANLIINEFHSVNSVKFMGLEMFGNAAKNQDQVWIPYREAFERSRNAIVNLINNEIDVKLYNFPLCAVDEEFHMICAKSITDYKIRFAKKCCTCNKKEICGGIFSGTIRLAENDVVPWSK